MSLICIAVGLISWLCILYRSAYCLNSKLLTAEYCHTPDSACQARDQLLRITDSSHACQSSKLLGMAIEATQLTRCCLQCQPFQEREREPQPLGPHVSPSAGPQSSSSLPHSLSLSLLKWLMLKITSGELGSLYSHAYM